MRFSRSAGKESHHGFADELTQECNSRITCIRVNTKGFEKHGCISVWPSHFQFPCLLWPLLNGIVNEDNERIEAFHTLQTRATVSLTFSKRAEPSGAVPCFP
jgi:hypothetical protein